MLDFALIVVVSLSVGGEPAILERRITIPVATKERCVEMRDNPSSTFSLLEREHEGYMLNWNLYCEDVANGGIVE